MTPLPSAIELVRGRAIVLRGSDIDTDRIMPARFLRAVTFEGIEQHLFADDRASAKGRGEIHPLDVPANVDARILLANRNFGCGSSREHAPQALFRWGIRAVVAESFSEIFSGNSLAIGLVCATLAPDDVDALMAIVEQTPATELTIDLRGRTASHGTTCWPLEIPDAARHAWLSGEWDATGLLLADYAEVERVDARLPYLRTTSRNA